LGARQADKHWVRGQRAKRGKCWVRGEPPSGINAGLAAFFTRSGGAGRRRNDRVLRLRHCRGYPLRG